MISIPMVDISTSHICNSPLLFAASAVVRWYFSWSSFSGWSSNKGWSDRPESAPKLFISCFCFSIKLNSSWNDWWKPSLNMSRQRLCSGVFRYLPQQRFMISTVDRSTYQSLSELLHLCSKSIQISLMTGNSHTCMYIPRSVNLFITSCFLQIRRRTPYKGAFWSLYSSATS